MRFVKFYVALRVKHLSVEVLGLNLDNFQSLHACLSVTVQVKYLDHTCLVFVLYPLANTKSI